MDLKGKITPSRIVLGVLIVMVLAAMIFSGRPWRGYSIYRVAEIATLPDNERLAPVRRYTEIGSGIFPHLNGPRPELGEGRQPLRVGWAYHEYGILGMPYWVDSEIGLVTAIDTPNGVQIGAITPGQIPLLEEMVGAPIVRNYSFRWYLQIWGWLFPPLFLLWLYLWRREDRQEEERLLNS